MSFISFQLLLTLNFRNLLGKVHLWSHPEIYEASDAKPACYMKQFSLIERVFQL